MITKPIPNQEEADLSKPEEHFLWALRNLPTYAGSGMVTHSGFLRLWSKHLWECGFVHRDYLMQFADDDGKIPADKLPAQQIRFQEPFRGPHHTYNNAARWARKGDKDPEPVRIPNIMDLTVQEREALLYQFKAAGMIPDDRVGPATAEVFND